MPSSVAGAIASWLELGDRVERLTDDPLLFPRLGRQCRDGSFPEAGGRLSGRARAEIVKPVMAAAGVPAEVCHPHVLRHTYGTLFMARPDAKLQQLRVLMGHADISTTAGPPRALLAADARRRSARNAHRAA